MSGIRFSLSPKEVTLNLLKNYIVLSALGKLSGTFFTGKFRRQTYREKYSSAADFLTLFAGHMVTDGNGNR
jgi:hypothetical protein